MVIIVLSFCIGCTEKESDTNFSEPVETDKEIKAMQYEISNKEFNKELVCDVLLNDFEKKNIPQELENGATIIEDKGSTLMLTSGGNLEYAVNESISEIKDFFFFYDLSDFGVKENNLNEENVEINNGQRKIRDICNLADDEDIHRIWAKKMSKNELQDIEKKIIKYDDSVEKIKSWDCQDYIGMEFEIVKADIPIMSLNEPAQGYSMEVYGARETYIQAIIGDGEIVYLRIQGLTEASEGKEISLISEKEALHIVEESESVIVSQNDWKIKEVKLEYVAIPKWESTLPEPDKLIPYWCIIRNDGEYESAVRINAITGGNLAYGE